SRADRQPARPPAHGAASRHRLRPGRAGHLDRRIEADLRGPRRRTQPRFQAMLDNIASVGTRAVQVWSGKSTADLGWSLTASSISSSYVEPLDTYCDMSHLIPREAF